MAVTRRIAILGAAALAMPAFAQSASPLALTPPTREEIQRDQSDAARSPPGTAPPGATAPHLTVEERIAHAPCPLAAPAYAGLTLTIRGAAFADLRGLAPAALRPAYAALIGRKVPLAALCDVRDAAAAILRRAGYVAAVEVPPQRIDDGIVHFQVVMARLIAVQVHDGAGRPARRLAAYLAKLIGQPLFNEKEAERYLLLARDLPGYDVRLVLRPAGATPGDVAGEVSVTRQHFLVSASLQNEGSHAVGRWGALLTAQANDLVGTGDRLTLALFNTLQVHEQTVAQAAYETRVGGEGLSLAGRFTYAWTSPDLGSSAQGLTSRTLVGSLEAAYPFRRSQAANLRGAAGIDLIDQGLDQPGTALTRDRLRVLALRLDFDALDPASLSTLQRRATASARWWLAGSIELRHGLGLLGATAGCGQAPYRACFELPRPSRLAGDPQATLIRLSGEADVRAGRRLTFALAPRFQYAFDPLLSYEQYSGGNYTIGRGYDPGAIVGDSGAGTTLEVRLGDGATRARRGVALQPYAFVDAAWVWNRVADEGFPARDRLLSGGGGMRLAWGDRARLDLLVAAPLHATAGAIRRGDVRALVSLSTRLAH